MYVYLEKSDIKDAYTESKAHSKVFFEPFDEYERLSTNKIKSNLPSNYPRVNDGSLAALLDETPMRVLAQQLTGTISVTDRDEPWIKEIANIKWREIVQNANTQFPFFFKWQKALKKSLDYGGQPIFSFATSRGDYVGADFTLPYIRHVSIEPGKISDYDSDYLFLDTYYTKLQLKNIIKREENEKAKAKAEGRKYITTWNVENLKKLVDKNPSGKDSENQNPQERNGNDASGSFYLLTTCVQRGNGAPFFTIAPRHGNLFLRQTTNENPMGDLPINFLYSDHDLFNPYGRGQIEKSGGTQNILDYMTQAHVLGTQIGLEPPLKVTGNYASVKWDSIVYGRRKVWKLGNDAQIETVKTNTDIYAQFPNVYGLYKTQLMNQQGTTDATVSGESGNPQYSKTDAGVKMQQERTNAHDNFLRQRVYDAFESVANNLLNITFSFMEGTEVIRVLEDEAQKLKKAGIEVPDTREIEINWEDMRAKLRFDVDPDSSVVKDNDKTMQQSMELIKLASENPAIIQALQADGYDFKIGDLFKQVIITSGIKDWEKVLVEVEQPEQQLDENGQPIVDPTLQNPLAQDPEQMLPEEELPQEADMQLPEELPEELLEEPQEDVEAEMMAELQETMQQYGIDERTAALVMAARREGADEETIIKGLGVNGLLEGGSDV